VRISLESVIWMVPYADEDLGRLVTARIEQATAFLLGRGTYEIFAARDLRRALAAGHGSTRRDRAGTERSAEVRGLDDKSLEQALVSCVRHMSTSVC
jgi:hypothetical protein